MIWTPGGQKRAARRSALMQRSQELDKLPPSIIPPLEKDEEEVLALLKDRRKYNEKAE